MANNRLTRDKQNAMIAGVCAGLANRLDLDPTLVRVAAIALGVVTAGAAILVYVILWIIMPAEEAASGLPSRDQVRDELRDAGSRAREAASILGRHAKEAAGELSTMRRAEPAAGQGGATAPDATPRPDSPQQSAPPEDAPSATTAPPPQPPEVPQTPQTPQTPPAPQTPGTPPYPSPAPQPGPGTTPAPQPQPPTQPGTTEQRPEAPGLRPEDSAPWSGPDEEQRR